MYHVQVLKSTVYIYNSIKVEIKSDQKKVNYLKIKIQASKYPLDKRRN